MKRLIHKCAMLLFGGMLMLGCGMTAEASEQSIKQGIFIGSVDVGGMTPSEAEAAVQEYVDGLSERTITLIVANGSEVQVTAKDMGISWKNPEIITEAAEIGQHGNVIVRYKMMKDLQHDNVRYDLELSYDVNAINNILQEQCSVFDSDAVDAALSREDGSFVVAEGKSGFHLDVEKSIDIVNDYMLDEWDYSDTAIALAVNEELPKGSAQELSQVQDVLGTFTTSFSSSSKSRSANVTNGCRLIDGITLYPGEEFSTLMAITPFTEENGYYMAASYLNGKVVDSLGGGICQVSTTLYNAVLLAELEVSQRYNHSMIVTYVEASADAAIAESAGKDFKFINNTDAPIYVEGVIKNKKITVNIYGKETRDSGREVRYESEIISKTLPGPDVIYVDAGQPIGYIVKESAHIGYKAKLWKVVKENGTIVERTQVNSSTYKMTPRYATVGVATSDPNAYNEIMAAIGTSNIDHVQNVIAILTAPPAAPQ